MSAARPLIEPAAAEACWNPASPEAVALSSAISLRRIADVLERHVTPMFSIDMATGEATKVCGENCPICQGTGIAANDGMGIGKCWRTAGASADPVARPEYLLRRILPVIEHEIEQRQHGGNAENWMVLQVWADMAHATLRQAGQQP